MFRSLTLLLTLSIVSLTRGDVLETGELPFLGKNLKPQECWALGNFLAQKAWDPFEASAEMNKAGGHSSEFKCHPALDFWAKELLPQSIHKMDTGNNYGEELLEKGLRFINRADLVDKIRGMRPHKEPEVPDVASDEEEEVDVLPEIENTLDQEKLDGGHAGQAAMEAPRKGHPPGKVDKEGTLELEPFQKKPILGAPDQPPRQHSRVELISPVANPTPGRVVLGLIIGFVIILLFILITAAVHSCLCARGAVRREVDLEGPDDSSDEILEPHVHEKKTIGGSFVLYDQNGSPVVLDSNANEPNHNQSSPRS